MHFLLLLLLLLLLLSLVSLLVNLFVYCQHAHVTAAGVCIISSVFYHDVIYCSLQWERVQRTCQFSHWAKYQFPTKICQPSCSHYLTLYRATQQMFMCVVHVHSMETFSITSGFPSKNKTLPGAGQIC